MRLRLPRPDRTTDDPAALPRIIVAGSAGPTVTPMGPDDPNRPVSWAVPRGIRTASEWAWRALVIGAALVAVLYVELRRIREGAGPQWLSEIFS